MFLCRINKNYPKLSPNTPSYLELWAIALLESVEGEMKWVLNQGSLKSGMERNGQDNIYPTGYN